MSPARMRLGAQERILKVEYWDYRKSIRTAGFKLLQNAMATQKSGIAELLKKLVSLLQGENVLCCLVGEIALNYYNVPRVIHDIEICVPAGQFARAVGVFARLDTGLQKLEPPETDVFIQYKRLCPRFRDYSFADIDVVLLEDDDYGFALNHTALTTQVSSSTYSKEILNVLPAADIADLPFPKLRCFFSGVCQRYKASGEAFFGIASEQLVDGMDISEDDCRDCLPETSAVAREYAVELAKTKRDRIDYFSDNTITCYVADEDEAALLFYIPGHIHNPVVKHK
ncbi:hypothetical protein LTR64_008694 [Lithohypha guttulata]|uniref:uncharacterized protein n=1 Tax=Lithohypha guttulata TaxID=1690604 RepID=UPI00315CC987